MDCSSSCCCRQSFRIRKARFGFPNPNWALQAQHAKQKVPGSTAQHRLCPIFVFSLALYRRPRGIVLSADLEHLGTAFLNLRRLGYLIPRVDPLKMAASLTPDAVSMILGGNLDLKPVVQCTGKSTQTA